MDVSGSILANLMDAGYPCRHDEVRISFSVGERRIMEHFVETLCFTCVLSTIIYTHMLNRRLHDWGSYERDRATPRADILIPHPRAAFVGMRT
jgi:hypothetical protein